MRNRLLVGVGKQKAFLNFNKFKLRISKRNVEQALSTLKAGLRFIFPFTFGARAFTDEFYRSESESWSRKAKKPILRNLKFLLNHSYTASFFS